MYRCWNDSASHRKRRVLETPCVSLPQCESPYSAYCWSASLVSADSGADFANALEPLSSADVPLSTLGDFGEDPRLDQSSAGDHDPVDATCLFLLVVSLIMSATNSPLIVLKRTRLSGIAIAIAKDRDGRKIRVGQAVAQDGSALLDVRPIGRFRVSLLTRSAVKLEKSTFESPVRCAELTVSALAPHSVA